MKNFMPKDKILPTNLKSRHFIEGLTFFKLPLNKNIDPTNQTKGGIKALAEPICNTDFTSNK